MKPTILIGLLMFLGIGVGCSASTESPDTTPNGRQLIFADEFDGAAVDQTKWVLQDPYGKERNHELQAYVSDAITVSDGVLQIKAERRLAIYDGKTRDYTSGMMSTYQKFDTQYGRFEISSQVPDGKGLWPAMWLLPTNLGWPPEIDVFEVLGQNTSQVIFTNHWKDTDGEHQQNQGTFQNGNFSEGFHVFAMDWSPTEIVWSVDGTERFRSTVGIPNEPMFLLLNMAIGGDWQGAPDDNTVFPAGFEVDYIRIYSLGPK